MKVNLSPLFWVASTIFNSHRSLNTRLNSSSWAIGLLSTLSLSSPCTVDANTPTVKLFVQPKLCILADGESACRDEVDVSWQAKEPKDLCLYRGEAQAPLQCWQGEREGDHTLVISVSESFAFKLRQPESPIIVAETQFQVVQDEVRYRHRRRNPWSFL